MAQARRRVARALGTVRRIPGKGQAPSTPGADPDQGAPPTTVLVRVSVALEEIGRWLEEFHPHSLVELYYGGLVHILDDAALRADESVGEVAAAITGMETGQAELAVAMHKRVVARWRVVRALESAN
jgi:hypothetical protein